MRASIFALAATCWRFSVKLDSQMVSVSRVACRRLPFRTWLRLFWLPVSRRRLASWLRRSVPALFGPTRSPTVTLLWRRRLLLFRESNSFWIFAKTRSLMSCVSSSSRSLFTDELGCLRCDVLLVRDDVGRCFSQRREDYAYVGYVADCLRHLCVAVLY